MWLFWDKDCIAIVPANVKKVIFQQRLVSPLESSLKVLSNCAFFNLEKLWQFWQKFVERREIGFVIKLEHRPRGLLCRSDLQCKEQLTSAQRFYRFENRWTIEPLCTQMIGGGADSSIFRRFITFLCCEVRKTDVTGFSGSSRSVRWCTNPNTGSRLRKNLCARNPRFEDSPVSSQLSIHLRPLNFIISLTVVLQQ